MDVIGGERGSGLVLFAIIFLVIVFMFGLLLEVVAFKGERVKLSYIAKQAAIGIEAGNIKDVDDLEAYLDKGDDDEGTNVIYKNRLSGVEVIVEDDLTSSEGTLFTMEKYYEFVLLRMFGVHEAPIHIKVCRGECGD